MSTRPTAARDPLRFNPFLENDGRTGWYAGASWRAPGRAGVTLLRYDNEADPTTHSGGAERVFSWRTTFWSLGAEADVGDIVLLGQAMTGSTNIVPSPFFSSNRRFGGAAALVVGVRSDASEVVREPGEAALAERFDPPGAVARVVDVAVRDARDRERDAGGVCLREVDICARTSETSKPRSLVSTG